MKTIAAMMTAKINAAISSIHITGSEAEKILAQIFLPAKKLNLFQTGKTILGHIRDDDVLIDEVIIGCENDDYFTINCHGNPLIVEQILKCLKKHGVEIVSPQEIISQTGNRPVAYDPGPERALTLAARIAITQTKTLLGAKIINYQLTGGLAAVFEQWKKQKDRALIKSQAKQILHNSAAAMKIIYGVRIVLAGEPNVGKSTLLNTLCGKDKAIVSDIPGTTRDWVSGHIQTPAMEMELIDTAGLCKSLSSPIDAEAQRRTRHLLKSADMVLYMRCKDNNTPDFGAVSVLEVFNKADILQPPPRVLAISAKTGTGIDILLDEIEIKLGVKDFNFRQPLCFNREQAEHLEKLI